MSNTWLLDRFTKLGEISACAADAQKLADALGDACDVFGDIMSELNRRKLVAEHPNMNATMRAKFTENALDDAILMNKAADAFEAIVYTLAPLGAPDVSIHECGESAFGENPHEPTAPDEQECRKGHPVILDGDVWRCETCGETAPADHKPRHPQQDPITPEERAKRAKALALIVQSLVEGVVRNDDHAAITTAWDAWIEIAPHDRNDCPCDHDPGVTGVCGGCNCADGEP